MSSSRPKNIFEFICQYKPKDAKEQGPTIQELNEIYVLNKDLSGTNSYGQSVADIASNRNFIIAVEWLAAKGIGLKNAVLKNDEVLVKNILDNKADVNAVSEEPILHRAVINCNYKILKMLLEAKANPDVRGSLDETALHIAAKKMDLVSTQLLWDHHADRNPIDYYGKTPSMILEEGAEELNRTYRRIR